MSATAMDWKSYLLSEASRLPLIRRSRYPEKDAALVAGLLDALDRIGVQKVSAPEETPSVGLHLLEALQGAGRKKGLVVCGHAPGVGAFTLRAAGGGQLYLYVQRTLEDGTIQALGRRGTVFQETLTTEPVRDWDAYSNAVATVNEVIRAEGVYTRNVFSIPRDGAAFA